MSATAKPTLSLPATATGSHLLASTLWIAVFAAATVAGARLEIPYDPVPFTLQTLMVLLAGAFLGPRNGALSQLVYLGAGVIGLPVFSGGAFGPAVLLGPTGGYLLAFPAAAALAGYLVRVGRSLPWHVVALAAALALIFAAGTLQLYAVALHNAGAAVAAGLLIFSWWDLLKLAAAAMIYHELAKRWPRLPAA